jgi:hypothetical protein
VAGHYCLMKIYKLYIYFPQIHNNVNCVTKWHFYVKALKPIFQDSNRWSPVPEPDAMPLSHATRALQSHFCLCFKLYSSISTMKEEMLWAYFLKVERKNFWKFILSSTFFFDMGLWYIVCRDIYTLASVFLQIFQRYLTLIEKRKGYKSSFVMPWFSQRNVFSTERLFSRKRSQQLNDINYIVRSIMALFGK